VSFAVFGKVVDGMDVVKYIEAVPKGPGDRPKDAVTIINSGEVTFHTQVKDEL
jgi:peptidyl-prolyl cis-trans isomerase B (cyclophilin B)